MLSNADQIEKRARDGTAAEVADRTRKCVIAVDGKCTVAQTADRRIVDLRIDNRQRRLGRRRSNHAEIQLDHVSVAGNGRRSGQSHVDRIGVRCACFQGPAECHGTEFHALQTDDRRIEGDRCVEGEHGVDFGDLQWDADCLAKISRHIGHGYDNVRVDELEAVQKGSLGTVRIDDLNVDKRRKVRRCRAGDLAARHYDHIGCRDTAEQNRHALCEERTCQCHRGPPVSRSLIRACRNECRCARHDDRVRSGRRSVEGVADSVAGNQVVV